MRERRWSLMQAKDANRLRQKWGDKPCTHPKFDKEYDLGAQTGDYVCTTCGEAFWRDDYWKLMEERAKK
jgi:hypothetical protein